MRTCILEVRCGATPAIRSIDVNWPRWCISCSLTERIISALSSSAQTNSGSNTDLGMWEMPTRGTTGIVGGSEITFRCHRRVVINLTERATCILYIDIVLPGDVLSALPHSQPYYCQQNKTLNAASPPPPTDVRAIGAGLAFNETQHGRTARKGSLQCLDK